MALLPGKGTLKTAFWTLLILAGVNRVAQARALIQGPSA